MGGVFYRKREKYCRKRGFPELVAVARLTQAQYRPHAVTRFSGAAAQAKSGPDGTHCSGGVVLYSNPPYPVWPIVQPLHIIVGPWAVYAQHSNYRSFNKDRDPNAVRSTGSHGQSNGSSSLFGYHADIAFGRI
ncbi:hypothetical protein K474DRAFT_1037653 [Panus rudis PR-1116 ss-1]|nr:hypothetical protein K474DRAFT_1037653 [Panus rudis PR-1116 ss-1]